MVFLMLFCTRDELGTNWSSSSGETRQYKEVLVFFSPGLGEQFQPILLLLQFVVLPIAVVRIITGMRILTH